MWESKMAINEIREIRCKTTVYLGVGAIEKIYDIASNLKNMNIDKVLIVTGRGAYKKTGAWEYVEKALEKENITYILYNEVTPNPTVDQVDEAARMGNELGAKAVIGIGGGSPIDAAKSVAILLEYKDKTARDIYEFKFTPEKAAPVIAINLTHGTGTEGDRFAVVSIPEKEYKPAIAYDCIYPLYAIDDPQLMVKLPIHQTCYVSVDAINHVVEASTSKVANPYTILLAKETVRLVSRYLPQALQHPGDLTARYYLTYASLIAGICFDNGLLHFTHALEHPLSGVKPDLSHGLGLGILLPSVIKEIYPSVSEVLADILSPIVCGLEGNPGEAEIAAKGIEKWLYSIGITEKLTDLGFKENDVEKLTKLAFETPSLDLLLSMAPIDADEKVVSNIFRNSL
ncbi:iron-containing alcohol dehydrogenase [Clostridium botulinum]|uniref:Alcohol dehydrogenase, iron-containing n=1 Tax=Clostridium botulinum (strain Langeland / NCTC 10281 / Type F) TaxID=441772 RepID=A7GDC7_CLOBL|nr:iron-containing alcohol dehydrogenase [Clostridium botulinum]ABS42192.1 alcohol dehydrogenase, iron-containing [Clostridium botulinum F str. Langeland]ADF99236.1 alcohol dehydrogenase, iron-containing protein [Clostridium botulinum F str. 230613]KKM43205.1 alcohol dehydrogenase [Clostridium botulinum]MBY6791276.1 iron-containing alcohol dehydrogenase [Clostridium botulinum]MBY6936507.1 iron-containing alcohol dehydrogenase [Clostridium botulinum]